MTCCDSIVHICLMLLSIVLLSLAISTLMMSGQNVMSPNASAQYIFSAVIIAAAALMFIISLVNIVISCRREAESEVIKRKRLESGSVAPISCTVIFVFLISIIVVALTSLLLSPEYSNSKIPVWYSGSLLGISLLTFVVSLAIIINSSTCCVRTLDEETQTSPTVQSGIRTDFSGNRA